jgi:hypothetical protein
MDDAARKGNPAGNPEGICTMNSMAAIQASLDSSAPAAAAVPGGLLIVTVDRLPAWMLSAWGATWVSTPTLDALAATGVVCDRVIATSLDPRSTLADLAGNGAVWRQAASAGWRAALVTDDPGLPVREPGIDLFEVPATPSTATALEDGATNLGRLCGTLQQVLATGAHRLVWCHAGSLGVAWDAPDSYRAAYIDPEDPPPPPGARVPSFSVTSGTDPDLVVGVRQVFAGQLTLLDRLLADVFAAVRSAGDPWAILVVGLRGMPLGLHGVVGCDAGEPAGRLPYGEWVHLPAILVDAAGRMAGQRYGGLVTPADLGATVGELMPAAGGTHGAGRSLRGLFENWSVPARDRVIVRAPAAAALVTMGWHLVTEYPGPDAAKPRLFVKPDDFFELCDVADRCPAVAEELYAALDPVWRGDEAAAWRAPLSAAATGPG